MNNRHTHQTDDELLLAYRTSSDTYWIGCLLERYTTLLLGVALKYLKNKTLAEDAVQQVFLKALTHLPAGEIANFKGWLYVLMRNHCLQQLRGKSYDIGSPDLEQLADAQQHQEEGAWREETLQHMEDAMGQLSMEQRETIRLFYMEKHSYEEITAKTGYTFMQVKSFVQNGKRNLKTILLKKLGNQK